MSSPTAIHALQNRIDQARDGGGVEASPKPSIQSLASNSSIASKPNPAKSSPRSSELPPPPDALELATPDLRRLKYLRRGDTSESSNLGKGVFGVVYGYNLDQPSLPSSPLSTQFSHRRPSTDSGMDEPSTSLRLAPISDFIPPSAVAVKVCRTPQVSQN